MELLNSPAGNLLSQIVGLLGLILACAFYFRSKRDKEPYWSLYTTNLSTDQSGASEALNIQLAEERASYLSISRLAFWNHGRLTIDSADLVAADPLRIKTKNKLRIHGARLIYNNNIASGISISLQKETNAVLLTFDYLDHDQGFVVEIIHEGAKSDDLIVKGAIKGAPRIRHFDITESAKKKTKGHIRYYLGKSLGLVICAVMATIFLISIWQVPPREQWVSWLVGWGWALVCLWATIEYAKEIIFLSARKVPPGLETFYTGTRT